MATIKITAPELSLTIDVDTDDAAADAVALINSRFVDAGGMWMEASATDQDNASGDGPTVAWVPAQSTVVAVRFASGKMPSQLRGLVVTAQAD